MSRWKAAAIHLSISLAIGTVVGVLLFEFWYPPPYFRADGGSELILLLVGVDLCVGPLLTLLVFRVGKRGLRFDLTAIAIMQAIALIYGMSVVSKSRPIFLVGVVDRFVLVAADEVTDADLAQGQQPQFRSRSWAGPRLVAVQMPSDPNERSDLAFSALSGRDAQNLPKYYRDFSTQGRTLLADAKSLAALRKKGPAADEMVSRWLHDSGRAPASVAWLPLQARKHDMTMLIDASTAIPLKALPIDPW
jgi:hypothetical protein